MMGVMEMPIMVHFPAILLTKPPKRGIAERIYLLIRMKFLQLTDS